MRSNMPLHLIKNTRVYSSDSFNGIKVLLLGAIPKRAGKENYQGVLALVHTLLFQCLQLNLESRICGNTTESADAFLHAGLFRI